MSTVKKTITTQQPYMNTNTMDPYQDLHTHPGDEKHCSQHQQLESYGGHCEADQPCHRRCHKDRLRRVLIPVVATILGVAALFALSCFFDLSEVIGIGTEGLMKRATGEGTGENTFISRKYYLIVIFVGLVVVVLLGICLSFWCCKSSFENPLCCPCYLCACCGGLACLECIGCGLCFEGADTLMDG
ncbi:hypothetical protein PM082_016307 [Marasmius tenuissimus]|nr:hypothetical protein PM082_016307 [Marasmius tenuissimus]